MLSESVRSVGAGLCLQLVVFPEDAVFAASEAPALVLRQLIQSDSQLRLLLRTFE